jgi:hypothetical protein
MKADKFTLLGGGGALLIIIAAFAYAMRNKKDQSQDKEVVEDHMAKMRAAKAAKKANEVKQTKTIEDANESPSPKETDNN